MNELSLVSVSGFKSKHDDFADTISMLASMHAWRPSEDAPLKRPLEETNVWELDVEDTYYDRWSSYVV